MVIRKKIFRRKEGRFFFTILISLSCLMVYGLYTFKQKIANSFDTSLFYEEVVKKDFFAGFGGTAGEAVELSKELKLFFDDVKAGKVAPDKQWEVVLAIQKVVQDKKVTDLEAEEVMGLLVTR